jgi:hypothetical protein
VPVNQLPNLIAFIKSGAARAGFTLEEQPAASTFWPMEKPPTWWRSTKAADEMRLDLTNLEGGYFIYYSSSTGYVCIFWCKT